MNSHPHLMHTHSKHSSKHVDSLDFHLFFSFIPLYWALWKGMLNMLYELVYLMLSNLPDYLSVYCFERKGTVGT